MRILLISMFYSPSSFPQLLHALFTIQLHSHPPLAPSLTSLLLQLVAIDSYFLGPSIEFLLGVVRGGGGEVGETARETLEQMVRLVPTGIGDLVQGAKEAFPHHLGTRSRVEVPSFTRGLLHLSSSLPSARHPLFGLFLWKMCEMEGEVLRDEDEEEEESEVINQLINLSTK